MNAELGKALLESKQNNYVYIFNHLTNAWKFAVSVMDVNFKKPGIDINSTETATLPTEFNLNQNYPNPFNPTTRIDYQLPVQGLVSIKIYDIQGNLVTTLISGVKDAGYHSVNWDAGDMASGVYFYRLISGSYIATKRLLLLK